MWPSTIPNTVPVIPAINPYTTNFWITSLSWYPNDFNVPLFILSSLTKRVIVVNVTNAATKYKNTGNTFASESTISDTVSYTEYPSPPGISLLLSIEYVGASNFSSFSFASFSFSSFSSISFCASGSFSLNSCNFSLYSFSFSANSVFAFANVFFPLLYSFLAFAKFTFPVFNCLFPLSICAFALVNCAWAESNCVLAFANCCSASLICVCTVCNSCFLASSCACAEFICAIPGLYVVFINTSYSCWVYGNPASYCAFADSNCCFLFSKSCWVLFILVFPALYSVFLLSSSLFPCVYSAFLLLYCFCAELYSLCFCFNNFPFDVISFSASLICFWASCNFCSLFAISCFASSIFVFASFNSVLASSSSFLPSSSSFCPSSIFSWYSDFIAENLFCCSSNNFVNSSLCSWILSLYSSEYGSIFSVSVNVSFAIIYTLESKFSLFTTAYPFNSPVPAVVWPIFISDIISLEDIKPVILYSCLFSVWFPSVSAFSVNEIVSPILYLSWYVLSIAISSSCSGKLPSSNLYVDISDGFDNILTLVSVSFITTSFKYKYSTCLIPEVFSIEFLSLSSIP